MSESSETYTSRLIMLSYLIIYQNKTLKYWSIIIKKSYLQSTTKNCQKVFTNSAVAATRQCYLKVS